VCGLGIDRPHDTTLGTIQALKSCAAVFYIHGDGAALKPFLETFCTDVRLLAGPDFDSLSDAKRIAIAADAVCAELSKGKDVAYATYGHPMLCSDGYNVLRLCRSAGYDCRVAAGPSSVDSILAVMDGLAEGFADGHLVCAADALVERPQILDAGLPAVLICLDSLVRKGGFGALCSAVEKAFPAGHPVFAVKCGDAHGKAVMLSGRVENLRGWEKKVVHMMSLVLPAYRPPA
jgi:hypothetical protein